MGDRCFKSDEETKGLHIDVNNLFGKTMSQPLPCLDLRINSQVTPKEILEKDDCAETG